MDKRMLLLLLVIPLLCGCGREMPPGETRLPLSETPVPSEIAEEPTIPEDWTIPDNAVCCRIEMMEAPVSYLFYDDHGNEILAGYPDLSDENVVRTHYTYADDGMITYRSVQDYFETSKERYVYNKDGTVQRCYLYEDGKAEGYIGYSYDKHGQQTREYYVRLDDNVCMYEIQYKNTYDDAGQLICQKRRGTGSLNMDTYYEYDMQGNVIHETMWSPLLKDIVIENRYTYDTDGRKLTAEQYGDTVTLSSRFTYVDLAK